VIKKAHSKQSCGECPKKDLITINMHPADALFHLLRPLILDAQSAAMKVTEISCD
jgi:hypothetical protein